MKSIITGFLLFTAFALSAQFDMEIAITSPANGTQLDLGDDLNLDVDITNWGNVLPQDDTLYIAWIINGTFYGPNKGTIQGASIGDNGVTFSVPGAGSFANLPEGSHTVCAWIIGLGSQLFGQNFDMNGINNLDNLGNLTIADFATGDPTPNNNEHCINITVVDLDASVDDISASSVKVYPNPAKDVLTVSGSEEGSLIEIVNAFGQVVLSEVATGETTLSLKNIEDGVYHVRIFNGNETVKIERVVIRS